MAEVINLNRVRKAQKRQAAAEKADANRLSFGQTKAQKTLAAKEKAKMAAHLDGAKLEKPTEYLSIDLSNDEG